MNYIIIYKKLKTFFNVWYNVGEGCDIVAKSVLERLKECLVKKKKKYDGISGMFHYRYYKKMFNKKILLVLNNGDIVRGIFNAEIPETESIQVGKQVIKIEDIDLVKLIKD